MDVRIREMRPADLEESLALWAASEGMHLSASDSGHSLAQFLARNPGVSSVACRGERIVGAVLCGHDGKWGILRHLAVASAERGRGVGTALMKRSRRVLADLGYKDVVAFVLDDNEHAQAYFRSCGFEPYSSRPHGVALPADSKGEGKPELPPENVRLRPSGPDDIDFVRTQERHAENSPFIAQWSREKHLQVVEQSNAAHLTVVDAEGTQVGYVVLEGLDDDGRGIEFTRVVIARKGRGIGRSVVRMVKSLAFVHYGTHRLWLDVVQTNTRARHVYRREGFVEEGTMRDSILVSGVRASLVLMSMLRSEYNELDERSS